MTVMDFLWTYVAGPILALLPARWRGGWGQERVRWEAAGTVSGIAEMIAAVTGMGYWYMHEMTRRIAQIMELAGGGKLGQGLDEHQIQGAALTLLWMSPVTWILLYFFTEGAVRLCAAAFTGEVYGSFPLWTVARVFIGGRKPQGGRIGGTVKVNAKLIAEGVRESVMAATRSNSEDELKFGKDGGDEVLEIWASQKKADWEPPKTVRVDESFYRLEETRVGKGPRPFQYRLRKVSAGVMGRTVIQYRTK